MVSEETNIEACPVGWLFLPLELLRREGLRMFSDAVDYMKLNGRANANQRIPDSWPKKQTAGKKSESRMLEELFDSQDYIDS
jgi:hypothetical protein